MKDLMFLLRGTIWTVVVIASILVAPAWAAGGYVHETNGEVMVAVGKDPAQPAVKNQVIDSNMLVSTGDGSHAVLKFEDGQVVAMQANTTFNISEYRYETKNIQKSNIVFTGIKGGLLFITGLIGQRSKKSFRLTTPNATIGVRGTEFMVAMIDGTLYGKVLSGSIGMDNKAGKATFKAGQAVIVSSSNSKPLAIPVEELPPGIFSQLEAIRLPGIEPATLPISPAGGASLEGAVAGTAGLATGSALLGVAATVAAGSTVPDAATPSMGAVPVPLALEPMPSAAETVVASEIGAAAPASDKAAPNSVRAASAWYDDALPPMNIIPAGSVARTAQGGNTAAGDASLFGRHNFTPDGIATAEVCVFCHTPQGVEGDVAIPLWNRTQSPVSEYKAYSSIGSATTAASGSVSMACLSCHDGTQAPNVVLNTPEISSGLAVYRVEAESGRQYLKNHHPVGMLYGGGGQSQKQPDAPVDALSSFLTVDYDVAAVRRLTEPSSATGKTIPFTDIKSGENNAGLYEKPGFKRAQHSGSGSGTVWWLESRETGKGRQKADFYLYTRTDTLDGVTLNRPYVECSSCHDPHSTNTTFLRVVNNGSAVCMTCHAK